MPRGANKKKGRALTESEFFQFLGYLPTEYVLLARGLWLSGMRISEAITLDWEEGPVRLHLNGKNTRLCFSVEGQKGRREERAPVTADFVAFLNDLPRGKGRVFQAPHNANTAMKAIGTAMQKAGLYGPSGKRLGAHDLRRSFATRWAPRLNHIALMALMRHRSLSTTLSYYIDLETADLSEVIWDASVPKIVPKKSVDHNPPRN